MKSIYLIDSKLLNKNLEEMNKDKKWVDNALKVQGYNNYNNIMLYSIKYK